MKEHYQLIIDCIMYQLAVLREKNARGRLFRRMKYRLSLQLAYLRLLKDCEALLLPYYSQPTFIINRFWAELDFTKILLEKSCPTVQDFFSWYCDSNTILRERSGNW